MVQEDTDDSTYPCVVFQEHLTTRAFPTEALQKQVFIKEDFTNEEWDTLVKEAKTLALCKEDVLKGVILRCPAVMANRTIHTTTT